MVKHYSGMIVRQQITSKDAEIFVLEGCINFKCGNQEAEIVRHFIADTLNMQVRLMKTEKSIMGGLATDAYN